MLKKLATFAPLMKPTSIIKSSFFKKKAVTVLLISASLAAFATLGDGGKKNNNNHHSSLLSVRSDVSNYKNFSLRSGYNFRGATLLNEPKPEKFIMLNTTITVQKGNTTYIVPMKKKVLLDKIKFAPDAPILH